ncbi:YfbU family protein [Enterococcus faecium]|uniref:YfbU family protein n=1 Tax=Enterococcus faecium TaxID=1352 RepID=UPI0021F17E81|nr:YfbU family protein [Enterococcus faecium]MCV6664897.1 YfbU family protein [Enterococcus faecium]
MGEALNPNEEKYYAEKIEILTEGYEYHYSEIFENISDPLPEEDSRFVLDIVNYSPLS